MRKSQIYWSPKLTHDQQNIIIALLFKLGEVTTITGEELDEIRELDLRYEIVSFDMADTWSIRIVDKNGK